METSVPAHFSSRSLKVTCTIVPTRPEKKKVCSWFRLSTSFLTLFIDLVYPNGDRISAFPVLWLTITEVWRFLGYSSYLSSFLYIPASDGSNIAAKLSSYRPQLYYVKLFSIHQQLHDSNSRQPVPY